MAWQRVAVIGLFIGGAAVAALIGQVTLAAYLAGTASALAMPPHKNGTPQIEGEKK